MHCQEISARFCADSDFANQLQPLYGEQLTSGFSLFETSYVCLVGTSVALQMCSLCLTYLGWEDHSTLASQGNVLVFSRSAVLIRSVVYFGY